MTFTLGAAVDGHPVAVGVCCLTKILTEGRPMAKLNGLKQLFWDYIYI